MTASAQMQRGLRRILWTLRPYLQDIVIIGGWVPELYRQYGGFAEWRSAVSLTQEVDILLERDMPVRAGATLAEVLRASGFHPTPEEDPAAIWESDSKFGDKVEFIVPHAGTARTRGEVTAVRSHAEIGGIALTDTGLLRRHTTTLDVPITVGTSGKTALLSVRVPLLGAYAATKAATFFKRQPILVSGASVSNPKSAKDLLYIRDLMAAGDDVVSRIEADLRAIVASGRSDRDAVRSAGNQLDVALRPSPKAVVHDAALMLAERDGLPQGEAEIDTAGHLTDCLEILRSAE